MTTESVTQDLPQTAHVASVEQHWHQNTRETKTVSLPIHLETQAFIYLNEQVCYPFKANDEIRACFARFMLTRFTSPLVVELCDLWPTSITSVQLTESIISASSAAPFQ